MTFPKSLSTLALLFSFVACGDSGAGPDESPQVTIQSLTLEGLLQTTVKAEGTATDDKGLQSLKVLIDDQPRSELQLGGSTQNFTVRETGIEPGAHSIKLEVYDGKGNVGRASGQFTVPQPTATYDANIFMMREDKIEPVAGVEFCLNGDLCTTTDGNGKVVFQNLDPTINYELGFIEGANPRFLVSIGKNRIDKNIVNYTNWHEGCGLVPTDSLVVAGMNTRTIIYFDAATVPIQELIDNFNFNATGDSGWSQKFTALPPILEVAVSIQFTPSPGQPAVDSMLVALNKGIEWANARYREIPYEDPQTYDTPATYEGIVSLTDGSSPNKIWISLSDQGAFGGSGRAQVGLSGGPRSVYLRVNIEHSEGRRAAYYFIEALAANVLSGVGGGLAGPTYDPVKMSTIDVEDAAFFDRTWTKKDRQVALIDILYDPQSWLIASGDHYEYTCPKPVGN